MRDVFAILPHDTLLHVFDKVMVALSLIASYVALRDLFLHLY